MSSFSKSKSTGSSSNSNEDVDQLRRGPWTSEEDKALVHYVASHGEGQWNLLAKLSGLKRNGKSCRLRWLNYLKPDVKRGNLTPREQLLILELHSKWGNRWSKIARRLPGRTDNEIKNYWRTRVQKQAHHLKMDTNSSAFEKMIRGIWMPMLVQKVQGSSISFDLPSQNSVAQEVPSQALSTKSSSTSFDLPSQNSVAQEVPSQVLSTTRSDSSTSPSNSNSGHSINIPEYFPYIEGTTNPVYSINANTDNYDITNFSLPITSTEYSEFQYPTTHNLTENKCTDYMDDKSFWDMDEFWQFR